MDAVMPSHGYVESFATHVSSFDTSMASTHPAREQTKLLEPNLPLPSTRVIFVWGWWQLGQQCAAGTAGGF
jgi:hypothetical protein